MRKKKAYQTPQVKVVKCQLEHQLLAASIQRYGVWGTTYGDDAFE